MFVDGEAASCISCRGLHELNVVGEFLGRQKVTDVVECRCGEDKEVAFVSTTTRIYGCSLDYSRECNRRRRRSLLLSVSVSEPACGIRCELKKYDLRERVFHTVM
jgi:hypothetical protein